MQNLNTYLQIKLNKTDNSFTKNDLANIKQLEIDANDLNEYQLYEAKILNDFINLEEIIFKNISLDETWINEILKLEKLTSIRFEFSYIDSIKKLIKLRLKKIEFIDSVCHDLEEINNFKTLNSISFIGMELGSLNILKNMPNLLEVKLSSSKFKDENILRTLDRIENLAIDHTHIKDLDFINNHINLKRLSLSKNQIEANKKLIDDLIYLNIEVYEDTVILLNKI